MVILVSVCTWIWRFIFKPDLFVSDLISVKIARNKSALTYPPKDTKWELR
jgi:hypothetical protein